MSTNPAYLGGLSQRKGGIAAGLDADLVVLDAEQTFTVAPEHLHFRHPVSPYIGARLRGMVQQTYLRGTCIYDRGNFLGQPIGREVLPEPRL
jgi:allantoinase